MLEIPFLALIVVIAATVEPPAPEETRVTILVDAFSERSDLRKDWGYAALVEHDGKRILFDTGNDSDLFRHNVDILGVDLRNLDFVVISHRHGDHTDGLRYLLELNPDVRIYVANDEYFGGPTPQAFFRRGVDSLPSHMRYFDGQVPAIVPHGSPWRHANTERIDGTREISPGIRVVANVSHGETFRETPEISLSISTPDGQILLVGCSHPWIEQILESVSAGSEPVRILIGGLHWVMLPEAEVERLTNALRSDWGVRSVAPGHCTGELGFAALRRVFGRQYRYAGLGTSLEM